MEIKQTQRELINLLRSLVKIDTSYPPGNSQKFDKFVRKYLQNSGLGIKSYYDKDKRKLNTVSQLLNELTSIESKIFGASGHVKTSVSRYRIFLYFVIHSSLNN